ncbi:MAG: hypothetical protein IIB14_03535 [Chloroflexi bacterium]|nr:hypothetical protein [Chloroflexota bacterium]
MGDEHDYLAQLPEYGLVFDTLLLVSAESGSVVHQEDVIEVESCVLNELGKDTSLGCASARDELDVEKVIKDKDVRISEALDVVALNIGAEAVTLIQRGVSDVSSCPETF